MFIFQFRLKPKLHWPSCTETGTETGAPLSAQTKTVVSQITTAIINAKNNLTIDLTTRLCKTIQRDCCVLTHVTMSKCSFHRLPAQIINNKDNYINISERRVLQCEGHTTLKTTHSRPVQVYSQIDLAAKSEKMNVVRRKEEFLCTDSMTTAASISIKLSHCCTAGRNMTPAQIEVQFQTTLDSHRHQQPIPADSVCTAAITRTSNST